MRRLMRRRSLLVLLLLLFVPAAAGWDMARSTDRSCKRSPSIRRIRYGTGQHRGIAIGAGGGAPVLAPASGVVSFAGTVPTSGKTLTIQTASGPRGEPHPPRLDRRRAECEVSTRAPPSAPSGPSGTPEFDVPYVHLGNPRGGERPGLPSIRSRSCRCSGPPAGPCAHAAVGRPRAPRRPSTPPAPAPVLAAPQPVRSTRTGCASLRRLSSRRRRCRSCLRYLPSTCQSRRRRPRRRFVEAAAPAAHVPSLTEVPVAPMSVVVAGRSSDELAARASLWQALRVCTGRRNGHTAGSRRGRPLAFGRFAWSPGVSVYRRRETLRAHRSRLVRWPAAGAVSTLRTAQPSHGFVRPTPTRPGGLAHGRGPGSRCSGSAVDGRLRPSYGSELSNSAARGRLAV